MQIKAFFLALYRTIQASREQARLEEPSKFNRIQMTERENALYFRFPNPTVQLGYGLGDATGRLDLPLADARALVVSIASACERRDVAAVKLQDFSLKTDARSRGSNPDTVIVRFAAPLGSGWTTFSRERLLAGCNEFFATFGRLPATTVEKQTDAGG